MTQEKQTSIRILQSKPTKKTLGKLPIFFLGLLLGILSSALVFFSLYGSERSLPVETVTDTMPENESVVTETHPDATDDHPHEEDHNNVYKQHLAEKDINGSLFKHPEKKPQPTQNVNQSPFSQILTPQSKPQPTPVAKQPQPPLIRPITKTTATTKVEAKPEMKMEKKTEATEAMQKVEEVKETSPIGSTKVSITSRDTEHTP